jgi:two-component system chemotaxis sensor kinase CheA
MNTPADQDASFIAEALPAFISEAQEQVASIEQLLLELEDDPGDRDRLDALFRCAHTVKGSAGIFGLDRVVAFTHHVETLLDRVREGRLGLTPSLSTLLLKCNDEIRALVELPPGMPEADEDRERRAALVERLRAESGDAAPPAAAEPVLVAAPAGPPGSRWFVQVRFGSDTFRNGLDPLAVLAYLRGLGTVERIVCEHDAVPALDAIDPEACHLDFALELRTDAGRDAIEAAFSFVREDCTLSILEPGTTPEEIARRIDAMPGRDRLGDILVEAGAISRAQLQQALRAQLETGVDGGPGTRLGEILETTSGVSPKVVAAALGKQQRSRESGASDDARFIRVQADRLDAVINLLGELVIAAAGASMLARQTRQGALIEANQAVGGLIEEIRNSTLQLRMVPIGETFSRFRRVVRDTAAELGKDVSLELVGTDTELDKSVVERIADPLMHVVRNALDHGLETPEQRVAAGKAPQGRLTLAACHEAGHIVIRIDDDGRGIQRDKVLQRAWDRGLVERGVVPPDAQVLMLIFEPGFSTAEKVTNLSGRGVGMDVVRRNIESLRGSVALSSEPGRGSRIEIRLPLTLAIIDGFLVGVGTSRFVFPLEAVVEVIEGAGAGAAIDAGGRGTAELRGRVLPVVDLHALYGLDGPRTERPSVVVIQAGTERFGVLVDQLLGQHQTVIKPLGRMFRSLRGMSGSSILGNGEVALIFDPATLGQLAAGAPALRTPRDTDRVSSPSLEGQPS